MSYTNIQPPFTLQFRAMSKKELVDYRAWFLSIIPERIRVLENAIRSDQGPEGWSADLTAGSLDVLGQWFEAQVETRELNPAELAEYRAGMTIDVPIETWDLTNRTYSLAMDIGMYLGESILRAWPGRLRWEQQLKSKRDADYGQLTIDGTGVVPMNPVGSVVGIAQGIVQKIRSGDAIRAAYDRWTAPDSALFLPPVPKRARKTV